MNENYGTSEKVNKNDYIKRSDNTYNLWKQELESIIETSNEYIPKFKKTGLAGSFLSVMYGAYSYYNSENLDLKDALLGSLILSIPIASLALWKILSIEKKKAGKKLKNLESRL